MNCTRCGLETERLYKSDITNEDGELENHNLCWDCDFDIINGGDLHADAGDVTQDRLENDYEYDPINNPRPW